jgi:hypothetical protein
MEMPSPILITGAARSGTSMVAGAINICGAFGGTMSGPNRNNQKGMFENHVIRNQIMKPYLQEIGADKMGQFPLPEVSTLSIPINWKGRVERILQEQGYKSGPWFYKGAKMCLMWPVWHYAFPNAKWIIVRRRTGDIARSCCKTTFMRAFSRELTQRKVNAKSEFEGWIWWVRQHEKRFVEMIEAGLNVKQIWPERMVTGDYQQLYETLEWLGLSWKSDVLGFIDPKLWKARRK